jgi:hypothetical protein
LNASAIEAFGDLQKDKKFEPSTLASVKAFLDEADKAKATSKEVSKGVSEVTNSAEKVIRFESKILGAKKAGSEVLRQNYLAK